MLQSIWQWPLVARYLALALALLVFGAFAVWLSIPEKKREEAIDALTKNVAGTTAPAIDERRLRPAPFVVKGALSVAEMKNVTVELQTTAGIIEIAFLPEVAPNHVRNFLELAQSGFYEGTRFHRVNPLFLVQGGDPTTKSDDRAKWGTGGSGHGVAAEFSAVSHERGILSMARAADPNSASSQFFILVERKPELDGMYTVFGKVIGGMSVVDAIAARPRDESNDRPYDPVTIKRVVVKPRHG